MNGLDRVRGLCVVSMVAGHFAGGSLVSKAVHLPLWADGAMGFVLLSGIVLGIVRRKQIASGGTIVAVGTSSVRRALELWGIFVAVHLLTFVLRSVVGAGGTLPDVRQIGSMASVVADVASLQVSLRYIDILAFYIWFLLAVPVIVAILRRSFGTVDALLFSAAVYLVDVVAPITFLRTDFVWVEDSIVQDAPLMAAPRWFALFVIGMALGWNWQDVHRVITRPAAKRVLLLSTAMLLIVARAGGRGMFPDVPDWLVDKFELGPLAMAYTVLVVLSLFLLVDSVDSRHGSIPLREPVMRFLDSLGRSSLSSYVIHVLVLFAFDLALGHPFGTPVGYAAGTLSLVVAWMWAARSRRGRVRTPVVEESELQLVASR